MRLHQTDSGKPQPSRVDYLDERIKQAVKKANGSHMTRVEVDVFDLEMVLDRLETLEDFAKRIVKVAQSEMRD